MVCTVSGICVGRWYTHRRCRWVLEAVDPSVTGTRHHAVRATAVQHFARGALSTRLALRLEGEHFTARCRRTPFRPTPTPPEIAGRPASQRRHFHASKPVFFAAFAA
jgi:hypothetical protein